MSLNKKKITLFVNIAIMLMLFSAANIIKNISKKPHLSISKQNSALHLNIQFLKIISMGNKRMISSLFWLETLMNSDINHYKKKDLI